MIEREDRVLIEQMIQRSIQPIEERVIELEMQVEALRRPLQNYQESKTLSLLWGKARRKR